QERALGVELVAAVAAERALDRRGAGRRVVEERRGVAVAVGAPLQARRLARGRVLAVVVELRLVAARVADRVDEVRVVLDVPVGVRPAGRAGDARGGLLIVIV